VSALLVLIEALNIASVYLQKMYVELWNGVVIAILEQFVGVVALRRFPAQAAGCQDFMMFRFQAAASETIREFDRASAQRCHQ
jgi:hypothetical protein